MAVRSAKMIGNETGMIKMKIKSNDNYTECYDKITFCKPFRQQSFPQTIHYFNYNQRYGRLISQVKCK